MVGLEAAAPAKLNLGLRILGRRADGYHRLESVLVPLDLADRVELQLEEAPRARVGLTLAGDAADVPAGAENLAARAAEAFLSRAGLSRSVAIRLEKHIPAGAGLGGGSSDAGAVLRLLARAWPDALPGDVLAALALSLGADVPYFLHPRPARVEGVGERVTPLASLPALDLLLLNPGVALPTAEVYRAHDALVPDPEARAAAAPQRPDRAAGLSLHNDLEAAAVRLCPELARLRRALEELGASAVGLSGSGATLYGVFPDAEAARAAGERARSRLRPGVLARVAATRESG